MKAIYFMLTLLSAFTPFCLSAQTSSGLNYQAVLRNNSYQAIENQSGTATVSILNGGAELYREIHTISTDQLGLFNVVIGKGAALNGTFSTLDWGSSGRSVKITVAVGGNTYDFAATELQAVPYAKVAERSIYGDSDTTNEIQTLALTGNQLSLSKGGGTVNLPVATNNIAAIANIAGPCGGPIPTFPSTNEFFGPTATVTLNGNQRVVMMLAAALGRNAAGNSQFLLDVGYQNTLGGSVTTASASVFYNPNFTVSERLGFTMTSSFKPAAGTYTIGAVVNCGLAGYLNSNEYLSGYYMIINE
ncbi:MAG: hypothetical protein H7246_05790 [Phycisphaerae bacterium]|nr:hypothetical protein [Saprospiraceae bacterium]